ncbi:MAG: hypothetical protein EPO32_11545 [Anaerolineae bacterium]|nr:MAG: hypothetical protein EPO32_11545 [Anaerolineae bacterium]
MTLPNENEQRLAQVLKFIEGQLAQGKDPKAVLAILEGRGAPRAEAIKLITQVMNRRPSQPERPQAPPARMPEDSAEQKELSKFVEEQLAAGKSQQAIADRLMARGIARDTAMDIVVQAGREKRALGVALQPNLSQPVNRRKAINANEWRAFIEEQIANNRSQAQIVETLVGQGLERVDAIDLVLNNTVQPDATPGETKRPARSGSRGGGGGRRKVIIGVLASLGGCAITAISYSVAGVGDTYLIWYGPIVFGILYIISGVIEMMRSQ